MSKQHNPIDFVGSTRQRKKSASLYRLACLKYNKNSKFKKLIKSFHLDSQPSSGSSVAKVAILQVTGTEQGSTRILVTILVLLGSHIEGVGNILKLSLFMGSGQKLFAMNSSH